MTRSATVKREWKRAKSGQSLKAWARGVTAGTMAALVAAWFRTKAHGVNPSRHRN